MTHAMEEKTKTIDEYIEKGKRIISTEDIKSAQRFQAEIIGVYGEEIPGLKSGLDNYSPVLSSDKRIDYLGDVELLCAKLRNYKNNLCTGLYKSLCSEGGIYVNQIAEQKMDATFQITLEQVVETINELSEDALSDEEKEILNGKLASLSATKGKDKKTRWETAKGILKWIADKGVDVGIATLPYIVAALK